MLCSATSYLNLKLHLALAVIYCSHDTAGTVQQMKSRGHIHWLVPFPPLSILHKAIVTAYTQQQKPVASDHKAQVALSSHLEAQQKPVSLYKALW